MNSYSAIFIPKINNKLKKIIKGIELLNLINNKINIQTGGSSVAEALGNLLNGTIYIYNTEDYEKEYKKMVAKFLKEIALLRAIIIELLSRLPQKDKGKLIPITDDKLDARIEDAATTIQNAFRGHKTQEKPTKMPADDIIPTFTFDNIKIYQLTTDNYISILSLTNATLWSSDIQMTDTQQIFKYNKANIKNIYIIHIISRTIITPFLVSFVNNDLRDKDNNQLKLYKFYIDIQKLRIASDKAIIQLREWFNTQIINYVNPPKTEYSVKSGDEDVTGPTSYNADSCSRYNIIYRTSAKLKFTGLTIRDTGTAFNDTSKTFGCVPFYIDIYEFISKFTDVTILNIIGNFNIQFYTTQYTTSLIPNYASLIKGKPFINIVTLKCEDVYMFKLSPIIQLFINLTSITIKYTDYNKTFEILKAPPNTENGFSQNVVLLFKTLKESNLQNIILPKLFTLDTIKKYIKTIKVIEGSISVFTRHTTDKGIKVEYID